MENPKCYIAWLYAEEFQDGDNLYKDVSLEIFRDGKDSEEDLISKNHFTKGEIKEMQKYFKKIPKAEFYSQRIERKNFLNLPGSAPLEKEKEQETYHFFKEERYKLHVKVSGLYLRKFKDS